MSMSKELFRFYNNEILRFRLNAINSGKLHLLCSCFQGLVSKIKIANFLGSNNLFVYIEEKQINTNKSRFFILRILEWVQRK